MTKQADDIKLKIARRAALELKPGEVVNLGIGIPLLVADVLPPELMVHFHTENGMLGFQALPAGEARDHDLVDAGKRPIEEKPGCSFFHSADSFAMVRGGHIDTAILGVLQIDERRTVANWILPGRPLLGVGGAMDLVAGASRVIVATSLTTKDGQPKIVDRCTLPISGRIRSGVIVTEVAVFRFREDGLWLTELDASVTVAEISKHVTARFQVDPNLAEYQQPPGVSA